MKKRYPDKFTILLILLTAAIVAALFFFSRLFSNKLDNQTLQMDKEALYWDSSLPTAERVEDLLARMSLAEKVGQMALVEKNSLKNMDDVARYGVGAILSGSGAKPRSNTPEGWRNLVNGFETAAKASRLGIPILYGVDVTHGHSNIPGATIFPHQIGLGAAANPDLVYRIGQASAKEMRATGIYWGFSPSLDVALDNRWGRMYESFGSDPEIVTALGQAYITGFQENGLAAATAKHFVGLGAMEWGTSINKDYRIDQGRIGVNEAKLRAVHLPAFAVAIESGVKSIMVGLADWQEKKLVANRYLLNDVLRDELGFQGVVVSDWYGVYNISSSKYDSAAIAINAGVDMIMLPFDYKDFVRDVEAAVNAGDISQARIDESVRRILTMKFELGLFDSPVNDDPDLSVIGSPEHKDLARQAVRESLVLLKERGDILPLSQDIGEILVAGSAADNLGQQSGGWTIEWQGIDGNWIPGTTILEGIRKAVRENTVINFKPSGDFGREKQKAVIGIAVVGEKPYAEGVGDNAHPQLSEEDIRAISNLRKNADKVIIIIISGRPLDISRYAYAWDTIIAAWLPGTEGQGVADVLFGDYPFKGKLPVSWKL